MRTIYECFVEAHRRKGYSEDDIAKIVAFADQQKPDNTVRSTPVVEDEAMIQAIMAAIDEHGNFYLLDRAFKESNKN